MKSRIYVKKANSKDYKPTNHERFIFNEIKIIIDNMSKWFQFKSDAITLKTPSKLTIASYKSC